MTGVDLTATSRRPMVLTDEEETQPLAHVDNHRHVDEEEEEERVRADTPPEKHASTIASPGWSCGTGVLGAYECRRVVVLSLVWSLGASVVLSSVFTLAPDPQRLIAPENTIARSFVIGQDNAPLSTLHLGLATTLLFVGWLVGAPVFSALSDARGRKPVFLVACALLALVLVAMTAVSEYWMFLALRVLCGATVGGVGVVAYVWGTEYAMLGAAPDALVFAGSVFQTSWSVGAIVMVAVAYAVPYWRSLFRIMAGVAVLVAIIISLVVPESPRWLLQKGRWSHFNALLETMERTNKVSLRHLKHHDDALLPLPAKSSPPSSSSTSSLRVLFQPRYLLTLLILFCLWFSISLLYYGLNLNMSHFASDSWNIYILSTLTNLISIPAQLLAGPCQQFVARRYRHRDPHLSPSVSSARASKSIVLTCLLLSGSVFSIIGLSHLSSSSSSSSSSSAILMNTCIMVGELVITLIYTLCYVMSSTRFPTVVRNSAVGLCVMVGRIGAMVCPLLATLDAPTDGNDSDGGKGSGGMGFKMATVFASVSWAAALIIWVGLGDAVDDEEVGAGGTNEETIVDE